MAYATVDQVQKRNPYRCINATSEPAIEDVQEWLDEAEALVDGVLATIGVSTPVTATAGIRIIRNKIITYVAGLVQQAYAHSGGDGGNVDGNDFVEAWEAWLESLLNDSVNWARIFGGGTLGSGNVQLRSHTTNNQDSLTVSNGDFEPEYEKGEIL